MCFFRSRVSRSRRSSAQAQLVTIEANGVIDSLSGSDPSLLSGVAVGAAWHASFTVPPDLALVDQQLNTATYKSSLQTNNHVEVGDFSATGPTFTMRKMWKETFALRNGTEQRTDVLQLWGNSSSPNLVFSTRFYYPVGTLNRFNTIVPSLAPAVVEFFLLAEIDGRSAIAQSYAERGSLDPGIRPVPEPSMYGLIASVAMGGAVMLRRGFDRRNESTCCGG